MRRNIFIMMLFASVLMTGCEAEDAAPEAEPTETASETEPAKPAEGSPEALKAEFASSINAENAEQVADELEDALQAELAENAE